MAEATGTRTSLSNNTRNNGGSYLKTLWTGKKIPVETLGRVLCAYLTQNSAFDQEIGFCETMNLSPMSNSWLSVSVITFRIVSRSLWLPEDCRMPSKTVLKTVVPGKTEHCVEIHDTCTYQ